jgi:hypothetical protein
MKDKSPVNSLAKVEFTVLAKFRQYLGAFLFDLPRFLLCMRPNWMSSGTHPWLKLRNRNETLILEDGHAGVSCDWKWTSDLTMVDRFPIFGRWLMRRALRDFPIVLREEPVENALDDCPEVSFLIGHRGLERLPILLMTLQSIAGQVSCRCECVVVEQDVESRIASYLPPWVRYMHVPPVESDIPFSRARAFNNAAAMTEAECVIFHDNDMLVPCNYAALIWKYHQQGFEVINLKRFIFYLNEQDTVRTLERQNVTVQGVLKAVMQNLEGGGSVGMDIQAFWDIGGFDNSFVGWGGEDNEFWERAETRNIYEYGFLPMVHLWHQAQAKKTDGRTQGIERYGMLTKIPPLERIDSLVSSNKRVSRR